MLLSEDRKENMQQSSFTSWTLTPWIRSNRLWRAVRGITVMEKLQLEVGGKS